MKKLMTMLASAAMAFGLFAEGALNNSWTAEEKTAINWNQDDLWSGATESVEIGTSGVAATPVIKFKTGSAALSRTVGASEFVVETNFFVETQLDLQGQALDEIPTIDSTAKIALFALDMTADEPDSVAGFYALAQYGSTAGTKALFKLGGLGFEELTNGLHRITIKAYKNVLKTGNCAGFVCFVKDGTGATVTMPVTATYGFNSNGTVDWNNELTDKFGRTASEIDSAVVTRFNADELLFSLKSGAPTFSAVDFIGTASVADITMNDTGFDYLPEDVQAMQVAADDIDISDVVPNGAVDDNGIVLATCSFTVAKDDCDIFTLEVSGTTETGVASIAGSTVTISKVVPGATVTITAAKSVATVKVGDNDPVKVASLDEAFTAIGTGTGTITLTAAATVDGDGIETESGNYTIDLAGKTLTYTGDAVAFLNAGTLTIKDSGGTGKVEIVKITEGAVIANSATANIMGGTFDGALFLTGAEGTYEITGGAFDKTYNGGDSAFAYVTGIPEGYKHELVSGYWTVTELATPAFSVEAGAHSSYTTVMINDVDVTADIPSTINEGETYEVTFEAASGYEFTDKAKTKVINGTAGSEPVSVIGPDATAILVESITVTAAGEATEVNEKATLQLTAAVLPADALLKEVTWSSSDDTLATVDEDGLVTGVKAGKVTITATAKDDSGVSGSYAIEVKSVGPTPIDPDKPSDPIDADNETEAIGKVKVAIPTAAESSGVTAEQYDLYFTKTAVETPAGSKKWVVTATLSETVVKAETETADVAAKLSDIAAKTGETAITIPAADVKPGLFYSLVEGQELGDRQEGDRELATTAGVTLKATHYDGSGFYQIKVSTVDKK